MAWLRKTILKWIGAGLLLGAGFLYSPFWVLGLVGAGYFLHLLNESESLKRSLVGAWVTWTVKASCAVWWFWSVYPIGWLDVEFGNTQLLVIFLYWFPVSVWLGAGGLAVAWLWWQLRQLDLTKWVEYILALPFIWIVGEVVGSLVFSTILIGPGGGPNTSFSFGYAGYHLAQHPLILQFAEWGGVYILSFLFAALVGVVYWFSIHAKGKSMKYSLPVIVVLLYTSSFLVGPPAETHTIDANSYRVAIIDTDFAIRHDQTPVERIVVAELRADAVASALAQDVDYVLLPEDARFFDQRRAVSSNRSVFQLQFDDPEVVLLDSGTIWNADGGVLQTFIYTGPNQPIEQVQKRYLVPQGEYVPYFYSTLLRLLGYGRAIDKISQNIAYRVGDQVDQGVLSEKVPGILFCFESVAPRGVKNILAERQDVPFIAHPISHAWFNEPRTLWSQLETMLRVQAVWNQKYIVSVANQASGQVYTPAGSVVEPKTVSTGDQWVIKLTSIPKD